jgi:hypothetical protein
MFLVILRTKLWVCKSNTITHNKIILSRFGSRTFSMGLSSSALNAGLTGAVIGSLSWVLQNAREGANLAREVTAACSDFARVTKTFKEDDDCFQWTFFFVGICVGSTCSWIITFFGCRRTLYFVSTATVTTSLPSFPLRVTPPIIEELPSVDVKAKRRRGSLSHLALGR